MENADHLLTCDTQLAKFAAGLKSEDWWVQEQARKKINSWLDTRLALMRQEERCAEQPSSVAA